jgi:hypothetical protein
LIFVIGILSIVAPLTRYFINLTKNLYSNNSQHLVQLLSLQNFHLMTILSNLELLCAALAFCMPAFRFSLSASFWSQKLDKVVPGREMEKRRQVMEDLELLTMERTITGGGSVGTGETVVAVHTNEGRKSYGI